MVRTMSKISIVGVEGSGKTTLMAARELTVAAVSWKDKSIRDTCKSSVRFA